jgi:hypothetical protein
MENIDSIYDKLENFIEDYYIKEERKSKGCTILYSMKSVVSPYDSLPPEVNQKKIESWIDDNAQQPFNEVLFKHIDKEHNGKDTEIYKKAGMDRKLFSKIRVSNNYIPRKSTVIALALALELDEEAATEFLAAAGYSLAYNRKFDLVVRFCIENRIYNLMMVNELLDKMGIKTLF